MFAGGCGVTYGHHAVWGFVGARNPVLNHADRDWTDGLQRSAGRQMLFLRELMESRPFFTRVPDLSMIIGDAGQGTLHLQATRDSNGTYAFVYFPLNDVAAQIDLRKLNMGTIRVWWYDPRAGVGTLVGIVDGGGVREFRSPPYGPDWVLVLDSVASRFPPHRPNGLRKDLVQLLYDMHPGFIRFPGGCIVEGRRLATRYRWKTTVGDLAQRKTLINRWNNEFDNKPAPDYFQSFGLGFYEYFQLAEDVGAQPLPS